MTYQGMPIWRMPGSTAYSYTTANMAIDADGAPNAYNPQNTGLDSNADASYPNKEWRSVLALDPADNSQPYVQVAGPFAGYFVSKTSLKDPSAAVLEIDPRKYVDATAFPYIVFPGAFYGAPGTGHLGDIVIARVVGSALSCPAIVADVGPVNAPLGEVSMCLATNLGGQNPNPRNGAGAPAGPFQYVVFPGTKTTPPWPRTLAEIIATANALLAAIGGWAAVDASST